MGAFTFTLSHVPSRDVQADVVELNYGTTPLTAKVFCQVSDEVGNGATYFSPLGSSYSTRETFTDNPNKMRRLYKRQQKRATDSIVKKGNIHLYYLTDEKHEYTATTPKLHITTMQLGYFNLILWFSDPVGQFFPETEK